MTKPVCAVVGVGPGNGAAFARRFADGGYSVALLARNAGYLDELKGSIDGSAAYPCDVTDPEAIESCFSAIAKDLGPVDVLLYNAVPASSQTLKRPQSMRSSFRGGSTRWVCFFVRRKSSRR